MNTLHPDTIIPRFEGEAIELGCFPVLGSDRQYGRLFTSIVNNGMATSLHRNPYIVLRRAIGNSFAGATPEIRSRLLHGHPEAAFYASSTFAMNPSAQSGELDQRDGGAGNRRANA